MVEYKGNVEYVKLSKETHRRPYPHSKSIPIIKLGIRNEQELNEVELPIEIPDNPLLVRLIKNELIGENVVYEKGFKKKGNELYPASGNFWSLKINSGKFKDISYLLEDFID